MAQITVVFFLTVFSFGGWKSELRVPAQSDLVRVPFQVTDCQLIVSSHGKEQSRESKLSCASYKGTDPIHEGSTHTTSPNPNYLPKILPSNNITVGGGGGVELNI